MTFVDTGAWFALYVPADPHHAAACAWMTTNTDPLLTTDYVIDETLTLILARGQRDIAVEFGSHVFSGVLGNVHYMTEADVAAAWGIFLRYHDKDWSFTDCTSKAVIERFGIATAFAFDHHFHQFGTVTVVP